VYKGVGIAFGFEGNDIYILPFLPHLEIKGAKKHTPLPCEHILCHVHLITKHAILFESE